MVNTFLILVVIFFHENDKKNLKSKINPCDFYLYNNNEPTQSVTYVKGKNQFNI